MKNNQHTTETKPDLKQIKEELNQWLAKREPTANQSTVPEYKTVFPTFVKELEAKLERGFNEYGDATFSRDPLSLVKEIQEEVIDISGWSVILLRRLKKIEEALSRAPLVGSST